MEFSITETVRDTAFDKEIVPWVLERQWHPKQKITKRRNGDIELAFEAAGLFEVFQMGVGVGQACDGVGAEGFEGENEG